MLPRPACRRAVQRQLHTPSESIWVSEEALSQTFRRFVNGSKTSRRYGSFVPGPMEARRRLGKRRMAHASEATPTPGDDFGNLWGLWGETERTKWQWEAPTTRHAKGEVVAPAFLPWLLGWPTPPKKEASLALSKDDAAVLSNTYVKGRLKKLSFGLDEVIAFRIAIERNSDDISIVCDDFSRRLKQSLTLGFVAESVLKNILNVVPRAISQANSDVADAQLQCLLLYQSIWDGLEACKVLSLHRLHGKTLKLLMELVLELPATMEMRPLSVRIVHGASSFQLRHMRDTIEKLVVGWIQSFLDVVPNSDLETFTQATVDAMRSSGLAISHVQQLSACLTIEPLCDHHSTQIYEAISNARTSLHAASEKLLMLEKLQNPWKDKLASLAEFLEYLPPPLVRSIIRSCTEYLVKGSFGIKALDEQKQDWLRQVLLCLAACLPAFGDDLFRTMLKKMACSSSFQPSFLSELMLEHWISQGYLTKIDSIRNMFKVAAIFTGKKDPAALLYAIDQHREACWVLTRKLVEVLDEIGNHRMVYKTVTRMHGVGMKLPSHLMALIITNVSRHDVRLAYNLYNLHFAMRVDYTPIKLEQIPNFVIAMIHNWRISPATIWKMLGIPIYQQVPSCRRTKHSISDKPLSPLKIRLFNKMAAAFAHSDRPPRVAFRNVMQCLHHMRRHRAPISPELSRAIAYSGITTKILNGEWVPKARIAWALGLIAYAEGAKVAETADMAVTIWNGQISEFQARSSRERNVLRVGPID